jgi:hypothetical protein
MLLSLLSFFASTFSSVYVTRDFGPSHHNVIPHKLHRILKAMEKKCCGNYQTTLKLKDAKIVYGHNTAQQQGATGLVTV